MNQSSPANLEPSKTGIPESFDLGKIYQQVDDMGARVQAFRDEKAEAVKRVEKFEEKIKMLATCLISEQEKTRKLEKEVKEERDKRTELELLVRAFEKKIAAMQQILALSDE